LISQLDCFGAIIQFDLQDEALLRFGSALPEARPMKITDVKTQLVHLDFRNCILLRVETDEGITGISETVMKRKTLTIEQSILQLRSYLIGKDPTDIEDHWEKMYRDSFWVGGPMHMTSISAVDCALWDILGKWLGVPVYKLLGGPTRREVPVYCHCPGGSTPEEFARNVRACIKRGYTRSFARSANISLPRVRPAGPILASRWIATAG
jgi:L-alanine-DL-glutamate epimerase-like enolase superfamily enzyme